MMRMRLCTVCIFIETSTRYRVGELVRDVIGERQVEIIKKDNEEIKHGFYEDIFSYTS